MRKVIVSVFLAMSLTSLSHADGDALFGLQWLASPQQVKDLGVSLELQTSSESVSIYKTDSLPKNHSMAESYNLLFYRDSVLVKILMASKSITQDIYGTEGKEAFQGICNQISLKNKITNKICYSGKNLYEENDEFYQCLKYEGCGRWVAFFHSDNKDIMLELRGLGRGSGYLRITAEAQPEWGSYLELIKSDESESDAGSF
jgi:hypothetical protein